MQRDYKSPSHLLPSRPIAFGHTQGIDPQASAEVTPTLRKNGGGHAVAEVVNALDRQAGGPDDNSAQAGHLIPQTFPIDDGRELEKHQNGTGIGDDGAPAYTLDRQQRPAVAQPEQMSVRRLTPVECERLMGWPDNWTAPLGVKAPDSKRYAACGDGIVSWVAYWIGCRIQMIEDETE